ncbi:TPA: AsmA family protein [Cronobacter sakazakii]|uniref:AsmA family protein n=2 Tax=Cronobacter sakazakii TaxID=28141 RepID=UPI0004A9A1EF|nr:AsmA family protein [Cronobacter sakazakii]EGT5206555.1 AsmA family protein [Cronobacter sakazakii]EGT5651571.1 AsmA family protein [Cronobacter sakazakii]EGT5748955.1 AsmA family protein [Cronobacter sakazakii]EGT5752511.1 AsmA family protein [Cronobacter sakazakii]EIZ2183060.1 AsmA family protein [Cronobacter sakazakii]
MTKTTKIISVVAGVFLLLVVVAIIIIATFDWNRLKPTINQKVSTELNRPFAIRGDLGVVWERNKDEPGWRSWVPWPHVHAEDVVLGNPPDIPQVTMIHLPRVEATLAPLALLTKTVYLPWIKFRKPDAQLIRLSEKTNNWTFDMKQSEGEAAQQPSSWSFRLDNILFDQGRVRVDDNVSRADVEILIDPLGKPLPFNEVTGDKDKKGNDKVGDYVFGLKARGTYNDQPLRGSGKIGGMLALKSEGTPFPVQADLRSGDTRVAFVGTVNDPMNMGGVDLQLKFAGNSLGDLYELTGVLLPDTPPFETDGRLVAKINSDKGSVYDYRGFNGRIGESDIHGSLTYSQRKPRPKLEGDLESRQLRLADLGPLIGVDSGAGAEKSKNSEQKKGEKPAQPGDKVLPHDTFETNKWDVMDADVRFKGRRIEHSTRLPISDLTTHIVLNNGDLHLKPLKFGMAGGTIDANIHLDGDKQPMQGAAEIQARRLKLKELMPDVELMQRTLGELNGDAKLRGTGNSVASLLGTSNGNLKLLMNDGVISRNLMEILGLNVGNFIVGQIFGDDEVRVNCAAANLNLTNGVARPEIFAFDTENALINITGTTSFADERLDLTINPESKGVRIVTLRSPLYVRGTFKDPDYGVKLGPLIARGAVAAALATLVTPAAALLALISPSEGSENQCSAILGQMKK